MPPSGEVLKVIISDSRFSYLAFDHRYIRLAAERGHAELLELLLSNPQMPKSFTIKRKMCSPNVRHLLQDYYVDTPSAVLSNFIEVRKQNAYGDRW
jgi:hypothetical protein